MKRKIFYLLLSCLMVAGLVLTSCGQSDKPLEASSLTNLSFESTLQAGNKDVNREYINGTEIMRLTPYKGKLYAGTSMWMETDPGIPRACQILVLDSPEGQWNIDHQFTENNLNVRTLRTVTFTTDYKGNSISPVEILLAAPQARTGSVDIFSLDDETGEWVPMSLGILSAPSMTRAIGFHHDEVTGVDSVFAGTDVIGTVRGAYDPSVPGRIRWAESMATAFTGVKASEFNTPFGDRVMGFTDCNGVLYCATSRYIFKRIDGPSPLWEEVYLCAEEIRAIGVRGLSAVPNPSGSGEVLIFSAKNKVRRIDPSADFKETIELDTLDFLSDLWGLPRGSVVYVLAAYNLFVPYTIPQTGEDVWLFGFQAKYRDSFVDTIELPPELRLAVYSNYLGVETKSAYAAEARYFIRHADGEDISYEVGEIKDSSEPTLIATRSIAVSPFPGDKGKVLYFSGFDCNFFPAHNSAWIYRGEPQ